MQLYARQARNNLVKLVYFAFKSLSCQTVYEVRVTKLTNDPGILQLLYPDHIEIRPCRISFLFGGRTFKSH